MIPSRVWDVLCCPVCYGKIESSRPEDTPQEGGGITGEAVPEIFCSKCARGYKVKRNVPLMIPPDEQLKLRQAVQGTKKDSSLSSFSEAAKSDNKKEELLQESQYEHKMSGWKRMARKLYPPFFAASRFSSATVETPGSR